MLTALIRHPASLLSNFSLDQAEKQKAWAFALTNWKNKANGQQWQYFAPDRLLENTTRTALVDEYARGVIAADDWYSVPAGDTCGDRLSWSYGSGDINRPYSTCCKFLIKF